MNLPLLIVLGVIILVARNRPLLGGGSSSVILRQNIAPGENREYLGTSPSPAGTEGTGNTNPLSVFGSAIQHVFWPKLTLAGNVTATPALPAGPPGDITDSGGGTPGAPPELTDNAFAYHPEFDSPMGYFDPVTETFIPH